MTGWATFAVILLIALLSALVIAANRIRKAQQHHFDDLTDWPEVATGELIISEGD